jgi:hypothetical protein
MRTLVVVWIALACRVAVADGTGVVVLGEPTLQAPVTSLIQSWLQEHGHKLESTALDADAQSTFANCIVIEDLKCARGVFQQRAHADSLVYVRVDLQGGSRKGRKLTLTGYWFVKEHDAVAEKRPCAKCDEKALAKSVGSMMSALAKSSGLDKGRVKIDSTPSGLVAKLDGLDVGVTPVEKDVGAGPHEISVVKDGKIAATRSVTVEAGSEANVVIPAEPEPPAPAPPPPVKVVKEVKVVKQVEVVTVTKSSRVVPGLLVISGVAAMATGGVFLYHGSKTGPNEPYVYPTATRNGTIIGATGAGVFVLGSILWFAAGHSHSNAPSAQLVPGGATLGWAGSF